MFNMRHAQCFCATHGMGSTPYCFNETTGSWPFTECCWVHITRLKATTYPHGLAYVWRGVYAALMRLLRDFIWVLCGF